MVTLISLKCFYHKVNKVALKLDQGIFKLRKLLASETNEYNEELTTKHFEFLVSKLLY